MKSLVSSRTNLRSKLTSETEIDHFPIKDRKVYVYIFTYTICKKETSYIDLTGTFPHKPFRGNLLYNFL